MFRKPAACLAFAILGFACTGEPRQTVVPQEELQQASAGSLPSVSNSATISGSVQLQGIAPAPSRIVMTPECQAQHPGQLVSPEVLVNSAGQLSNVLVYVKDYKGTVPRPRDPITIEDNGCQIEPHVTAAMAGQEVRFQNADKFVHRLRVSGGGGVAFDAGPFGDAGSHVFQAPQLMMQIRCETHPWEISYLSILPNPWFSVTGSDGGYAITDLPPGTYTLEAVHEKYGVIDQQVTVGPSESKPVAFTFKTP